MASPTEEDVKKQMEEMQKRRRAQEAQDLFRQTHSQVRVAITIPMFEKDEDLKEDLYYSLALMIPNSRLKDDTYIRNTFVATTERFLNALATGAKVMVRTESIERREI